MNQNSMTQTAIDNHEQRNNLGGLLHGVGPTMTELSYKGLLHCFLNEVISARTSAAKRALEEIISHNPEPKMQTK